MSTKEHLVECTVGRKTNTPQGVKRNGFNMPQGLLKELTHSSTQHKMKAGNLWINRKSSDSIMTLMDEM